MGLLNLCQQNQAELLKSILIPSNGYTISYIRNLVGNNTLLCFCPMSCFSLNKPTQPVANQSPQTKCPKCSFSIPTLQLRKHSFTCYGINSIRMIVMMRRSLKGQFFDKVLPLQQTRDESKPSGNS